MLDVKIKNSVIAYHLKWFYAIPSRYDALLPVAYMQSVYDGPVLGFVKERFPTILIDLAASEYDLEKGCRKNTRYEIRRARDAGVTCEIEHNVDRFVSFYNLVADRVGLGSICDGHLAGFGQSLCVTKAMANGRILAAHSYVVDRQSSRARLLQSVSLFREVPHHEQATIGRANRFLHYEDMLFFKRQGIRYYDLGGYAQRGQRSDLEQISKFKSSFGGTIVEEANYTSIALCLMRRAKMALKQFLRLRGRLLK